jgi:Tol biopolymer transport system component
VERSHSAAACRDPRGVLSVSGRFRPDGRRLRHITARGGDPAFSPDGRWLAFVAERNGNQELYKVRANGRGMVQLTNTYGITEAAPRWQRAP